MNALEGNLGWLLRARRRGLAFRRRRPDQSARAKIMGLPGKPEGIDGSEVERYFLEGAIKEIAEYCEVDVVNTYRIWLRYE